MKVRLDLQLLLLFYSGWLLTFIAADSAGVHLPQELVDEGIILTRREARNDEQLSKLSFKITNPTCPRAPKYVCDATSKYRSINGACNNLQQPWWGQSNSPYKRLLSPHYDDGLTEPRTRSASRQHTYLPGARTVANDVFDDSSKPSKSSFINLLLPYFAQLVSYDLSATVPSLDRYGQVEKCKCNSRNRDCFNIPIPKSDKVNKDQKCMSMVRSLASVRGFDCSLGPREQLNNATHWLDLSVLYGSSQEQANTTRTFSGGLLKSINNTRTGELYFALNQTYQCKYSKYSARYFERERCYLTGDKRIEDNAVLTSLLTLFLREHNRLATELASLNPLWTDEKTYQEARRIVIAIYQNIVYSEFLPAVIGTEASISFGLPTLKQGYFTRYSASVYPQVNNEFATAASRFFQTMLPLEQTLVGKNKHDKVSKSISFFQFNNQLYEKQMNSILRGLLTDSALTVKPHMNKYLQDWLWNELFYDEDTKRWSLTALNIQQGRDHGLGGYNKYRKLCGLREAKSFSDLTNIPEKNLQILKRVYSSVDDIDLFVGLVSENPLKKALVGQTAACIIGKQFRDLKLGDRFYFETSDPVVGVSKRSIAEPVDSFGPSRFSPQQLDSIRQVTLSELISQNSDIGSSLQSLAFSVPDSHTNPPLQQNTNTLDTSLWFNPDDLYVDCSSSYTYNSTTAVFSYSFSSPSVDLTAFAFSVADYTSAGLLQSTVSLKCFPLNRTVIFTVTASEASVNLNIDQFHVNTNNASLLIYIYNMQSTSIQQFTSESDNNSTLALNVIQVPGQVYFGSPLRFNTYEFSKSVFNVDSVGSVTIDTKIEFYIYDNSSAYHSINNVNSLQISDAVYVYTNSTTGVRGNETQNNLYLVYSDINKANLTCFTSEWFVGGETRILIENVEQLTINSDSNLPPYGPITGVQIGVQFSLIVRDVYNLSSKASFSNNCRETINGSIIFENIETAVIDGNINMNSYVQNIPGLSLSISFRNITYLAVKRIGFLILGDSNLKASLSDIDTLIMTDQIIFNYVGSGGTVNSALSLIGIRDAFINTIFYFIPQVGTMRFRMEQINIIRVPSQLTITAGSQSQIGTTFFEGYILNIQQLEIGGLFVNSQGEQGFFKIDRVNRLTAGTFAYNGYTPFEDKTRGFNNYTVSNVQYLTVSSYLFQPYNGASSANLYNIGQMIVTSDFAVLCSVNATFNLVNSSLSAPSIRLLTTLNATTNVTFGPNVQSLNIPTVRFNVNTNTSSLVWNLKSFDSVIFNVLTGSTTNGIAKVNLIDVYNTTIGNITNSFDTTYGGIRFNMFGSTNYFKIASLANSSWANTLVKLNKDQMCSCQNIIPL